MSISTDTYTSTIRRAARVPLSIQRALIALLSRIDDAIAADAAFLTVFGATGSPCALERLVDV